MRVLLIFLLLGALPFGYSADEPEVDAMAEPADSKVIILTDENFEHDTQASTGSTTGDWLVEFYAPWCGHCKQLAPVWTALAATFSEPGGLNNVNVAKIDATANPEQARRFGVSRYPTIIFLKNGKYYLHEGARAEKDFTALASGGYNDLTAVDVPAAPTQLDLFKEQLLRQWKLRPSGCIVIFTIGCLCGMFFAVFTGMFDPPRAPVRRLAAKPTAKPAAKAAKAAAEAKDDTASAERKPAASKKAD